MAQLVEHVLGKDGVPGSNPGISLKRRHPVPGCHFHCRAGRAPGPLPRPSTVPSPLRPGSGGQPDRQADEQTGGRASRRADVLRPAAGNNPKKGKKTFSPKPLDKQTAPCYTMGAARETPWDSRAGVAELADARDLKSRDTKVSYRFEPGVRHFPCSTEYRGVEQSGSSSGS